MQIFCNFFKRGTVGFYLACIAALLSVVGAIVYGACYSHSVYLDVTGVVLPIIGGGIFVAAVVAQTFIEKCPHILKTGIVLMWLFDFIGFIVFINASYLYLSEVFFGGTMGNMSPAYVVCVLFYLLSVVLSNVAMYLKTVADVNGAAVEEI